MAELCRERSFSFFETGDEAFLNASNFPQVTECAQHTVLILLPCFFYILCLPIIYFSINKSQNGPVNKNIITWFKLVFCITLVIATFLTLLSSLVFTEYTGYDGTSNVTHLEANYSARLASLFLLVFCLISAFLATMACQCRGVVSSGTLFNFWLLLLICGVPELRFKLGIIFGSHKDHQTSHTLIYLYFIYYLSLLSEFLLCCFADTLKYVKIQKKTCPEEYVSFLNQIIFWWFNGLARLGHKRALEIDDLWNIPDRDTSRNLLEKFERIREKQLKKFKNPYVHPSKTNGNIKLENNSNDETRKLQKDPIQQESKRSDKPSVVWPLFLTFKWIIFSGAIYKLAFDLLQFVSPYLLKHLIKFVENPQQPIWIGISISILMFVTAFVQSLLLHQYFHGMFRLGMNVRSILTSSVYKKALYLSNGARKNRTVGEIVNLMSVDIQRIQDIAPFIMLFWSAPLQILLSIFFLWRLFGIAVFMGVFVLIALIPLNTRLSMIMRNFQQKQMTTKDNRLKMLNEMLNGIKVVKLYAWEIPLSNKIFEFRKRELDILKKLAFVNAGTTFSWTSAPFLVAVFTFATYVIIDPENNILTPEVTFVGLTLFNILRFPLAVFAMIFGQAVQCIVSNRRIKEFLAEEELEKIPPGDANLSCYSVCIRNASFSWDLDGEHILKNINLSIEKGSLIAVIGKIGSGKSSLISAIFGDMYRPEGEVVRYGNVAFVPQQAWIQNSTLRQNILFGKEFDEILYERVLDACALLPDLEDLPAGDRTEIGEKGINLSGGQKQRLSLARALYSQRDVYVFDDPLSALDANVGKWIFNKVIGSSEGILRKNTRIMVTHSLPYLKFFDQIIVLDAGRVVAFDSYSNLIRNSEEFSTIIGEFLIQELATRSNNTEKIDQMLKELSLVTEPTRRSELIREISEIAENLGNDAELQSPQQKALACLNLANKNVNMNDMKPSLISATTTIDRLKSEDKPQNDISDEKKQPNRLIEKEQVFTGQVKFGVYLSYLKSIGWVACLLFFIVSLIASALGLGANFWLANWSDDSQKIRANGSLSSETLSRLGIYAALGFSQAVFVALSSILMSLAMVNAAKYLHENMVRNIFRSTMGFFDTTPLGRIVNRFSKDIDGVDTSIPRSFMAFIRTALASIEILLMIALTVPTFIFGVVPLSVVYFIALRYYVSTSRQLKRLESTTRSPIYSHFQESIQGATSIRAYECFDRFLLTLQNLVDKNMITYLPSIIANRWLAVRLELVGNLIVFTTAFSAVWLRDEELITAGLIGLAVAYALSVTQALNWCVRMTGELETHIVSVERILEYSHTSKESENETDPQAGFSINWPEKGKIIFDNLSLRYRPELDLVLRDFQCIINPGERVGVVGRTGAGKSSLALGLFRIIEPANGKVLIDQTDISRLSLFDLRSNITIIPQEPVLFSGTLRFNLDPFNRFTDERVWEALEHSHLRAFVTSLSDGLSHQISEGGENISLGQRQLICLARALLRRSRILILDEATASVDMATDSLIQEAIRKEFNHSTILTIAHRLNTIMDYDRVMVLDAGRIREFDSPQRLIAKHDSLFAKMAADSN